MASFVVVLGATSCSADGDAPIYSAPTTSSSPTKIIDPTTPAAPAPLFPLTGEKAPSAEAAGEPAVAIPVLSGPGLPTAKGLSSADAVWVTFPTGSSARAVAVYQSSAPSSVGPVSATRPVDAKVLPVLHAGLAYAGGPAGYVKQLNAAKIPQLTSVVHPEKFTSSGGSLYLSVKTARGMADLGRPRSGIFSFDSATPTSTAADRSVRIAQPGRTTDTLTWKAKEHRWVGSVGGLPLSARNVVVQVVPYAKQIVPRSGRREENNPDVFGQGTAVVLTAGHTISGSWSRSGRQATTGFTDSKSNAVRLSPGSTWILLVPKGTTVR